MRKAKAPVRIIFIARSFQVFLGGQVETLTPGNRRRYLVVENCQVVRGPTCSYVAVNPRRGFGRVAYKTEALQIRYAFIEHTPLHPDNLSQLMKVNYLVLFSLTLRPQHVRYETPR